DGVRAGQRLPHLGREDDPAEHRRGLLGGQALLAHEAAEARLDRRPRARQRGIVDVADERVVAGGGGQLGAAVAHDPAAEHGDLHAAILRSPEERSPSSISPISPRCTSLLPSTICSTFASRYMRPTRWSGLTPAAPRTWIASAALRCATSDA